MSVGDGIFLAAVLLSVVGLYIATRDRWNWKRVVKWTSAVSVALVAVLGVGLWAYQQYDNRLKVEDTFEGLTLASSAADVRFLKGEPTKDISIEDEWVYLRPADGVNVASALIVVFKNDRIRLIRYSSNGYQPSMPWLQGQSTGNLYASVIERLGPPSNVATSEDGLSRILSYEKYRTFYSFSQGKLVSYGIYDPATGPVKFSAAGSEPSK